MYSDNETCSQESEDNFAKELQQYIQAKEMANAAQSLPFPEESVKKEGVKDTQKGKGETILSFEVYIDSQSQLSVSGLGFGEGESFFCILFQSKIMLSLGIYARCELARPEMPTPPPKPGGSVYKCRVYRRVIKAHDCFEREKAKSVASAYMKDKMCLFILLSV